MFCSMARDFEAVAILVNESGRIQDLRAYEEMYPAEVQRRVAEHHVKHAIESLLIHAERRRPAPHAHCSTLSFAGGVHTNGNIRPHTQLLADLAHPVGFRERFEMDLADTLREHELQFSFRFSRAGKKYLSGVAASLKSTLKLTNRSNLQAATTRKEMPQNRLIRIRLDRVGNGKARWQRPA